jgi:hypothetical protein
MFPGDEDIDEGKFEFTPATNTHCSMANTAPLLDRQ